GMEKGNGLAHAGGAAALGADLADTIVFWCGLDDSPAFADVVPDRLLNVDVLPGLHGPDRRQGVPVIRCSNADDVDRPIIHDLAEVLFKLRGLAMSGFD